MTREEAIKDIQENIKPLVGGKSLDMAIEALKIDTKEIFYDGYAYCLMDFGRDTVLCNDCKHYKQSAVADRKMCFRKDVDGVEVCYDFQPYDSCTYGERKDGGENETD